MPVRPGHRRRRPNSAGQGGPSSRDGRRLRGPGPTDAFEFVLSLGERGTDRALVVDGDRLVGIVSESDVADAASVLQGLGPVDRSLDAPEGYA